MSDTQRTESISTRQQQIASMAQQASELSFTSLNHYLDLDWLREAYRRTRKDGAVGVDGQTAEVYAEHLEENLQDLLDRAKSGRYRAPAVKRAHIPKGDGTKTRPIGIPTFEDKILQRAVAMVLEPIYEQDFLACSYGFRPGRSAHQALEFFRDQLMNCRGGWVLEVDLRKFFDNLDHGHLRTFLRRRVRDGGLLRLIDKWLSAGVMEDGSVSYPDAGSPQGGVVSPLLSNVFLHYVLDLWFEQDVKPRMRGLAFLVRYADDFVIGFSDEHDAQRVLDVVPKRFERFGLTVHPTKTKLVSFRPPPSRPHDGNGSRANRPGTFDLLGFTHSWGRSQRGYWVVKHKTASDRFSRSLRSIDEWCRTHRHWSLTEQQQKLNEKLRGHYAYYGVTGNSGALSRFLWEVERLWRKWLSRRNRSSMNWTRFRRILQQSPLARVRTVRSVYRLAANP